MIVRSRTAPAGMSAIWPCLRAKPSTSDSNHWLFVHALRQSDAIRSLPDHVDAYWKATTQGGRSGGGLWHQDVWSSCVVASRSYHTAPNDVIRSSVRLCFVLYILTGIER